ncbi:MAG: HAD family hydrolase [Candidatus Nanoarchaeia archaeon]|jgi:D-glycero-D-manno-heptose 1,7-bisphosphate phosphatase
MELKKPAVFLDRDGVIIKDVDHITKEEDVSLIPKAAEAIALLNKKYKVIIITNQAAVGRGMCSEEQAMKVHLKVISLLKEKGARVDATYMCFHHAEKGIGKYKTECDCRKPKPGMLIQAAKEHNIDLKQSFMVGDKKADIKAGLSAGVKTILVLTGYGGKDNTAEAVPNYTAEDLYDAAKIILGENK